MNRLSLLLLLLAAIAAVLWLLAGISIGADMWTGRGFPLLKKFPNFQDILIYRPRFQLYHSAAFYGAATHARRGAWSPVAFAYTPAAAPIYAFFYQFQHPENVYLTLIVTWTLGTTTAAFLLLRRFLRSSHLAVVYLSCVALFSFPLLFLGQRANIELLVWMLISAAVWVFLKGHLKTAAVLIGLAASIKIYPILLLGLFLTRRRDLSAFVIGFATAVLATLVAVWFSGPTFSIALTGFFEGVQRFNHEHAETARRTEAVFDHSLFSPVKLFYLESKGSPLHWTTAYFVLAGLGAAAVFLLRVRTLPFLNRYVFLSTAMVVLPPVSYEYTLVHLYLPLLLLLVTAMQACRQHTQDREAFAEVRTAVVCALVALLPLGLLAGGTFRYAGTVQLVALLALAGCAALTPWHTETLSPQAHA